MDNFTKGFLNKLAELNKQALFVDTIESALSIAKSQARNGFKVKPGRLDFLKQGLTKARNRDAARRYAKSGFSKIKWDRI